MVQVIIFIGLFFITPIFSIFYLCKYYKKIFISILCLITLFIFQFICYQNYKNINIDNKTQISVNADIKHSQYSTTFIGKIKNKKLLILIPKNENLQYSDIIIPNKYKLREIENNYNNDSSFDSKQFYLSKKIIYKLDIKEYNLQKKGNQNIINELKNFRNTLLNLNFKSQNIINALLFGKNNFSQYEKNLFNSLGISHVFSISGLHISILFNFLLILINFFKPHDFIQKLLLSTSNFIYYFLAGCNIPVARAIFTKLGNFIFKIDNLFLLNIFVIISLIFNPFIIYNKSFLLSCGISYILLLNRHFQNFHLSVILFLFPLLITINFNYSINFLTPIINMIFVPIIIIIFIPLSILITLTQLQIFDNFCYYFYQLILSIFEILNFFTISIGYQSFIKLQVFAFIFYYIWKYKKFIFPLIYFSICLLINPTIKKNELHFINVGQGDAMLFSYNFRMKNILIDTGNTNAGRELITYLKYYAINKIDLLIISHFDKDHSANIKLLQQFFSINKIISTYSHNNYKDTIILKKMYTLKEDDFNLYFLPPLKKYEEENNMSLVCLLEFNKYKILLTGDIEKSRELDIINNHKALLKNITLLKAAHHGSKTSSSEEFLKFTNPQYIIISAGKNNIYKHPSPLVIDRYKQYKIKFFQLKDLGNIIITF